MSLLKAAEASIENGLLCKALNAFIKFEEHASVRAATAAAQSRVNSGSSLSAIDGRLVAVKDNICTSKLPTTCSSNALAGFCSPYEATVARKLKTAGAITIGKTNLDEFGMGSHSTNSVIGPVSQAKGNKLSAGGSSGGSAVAVASNQCWASLGTDTGGSVRLPAAYTGTIGFKPSYGVVSRFGVVPYANSLDTVGILGREIDNVRKVFEVIRGFDVNDPTSLSHSMRSRLAENVGLRKQKSTYTIGIPLEYNIEELQPAVRTAWQQAISKFSRDGHQIVPVSLPTTKLALSAYYILAPAEASSNLAKYDAVRYGHPASSNRNRSDVLFSGYRNEKLGEEVRRRILLGSFTLSASAIDNYFIQAQRVRRLVQRDFDAVFAFKNHLVDGHVSGNNGVDFLLVPTAPSLPPSLADIAHRNPLDSYGDDVFTVPTSLAGLPSISLPTNMENIVEDKDSGSIGLQLIGQFGDDDFILDTAEKLAESIWTR